METRWCLLVFSILLYLQSAICSGLGDRVILNRKQRPGIRELAALEKLKRSRRETPTEFPVGNIDPQASSPSPVITLTSTKASTTSKTTPLSSTRTTTASTSPTSPQSKSPASPSLPSSSTTPPSSPWTVTLAEEHVQFCFQNQFSVYVGNGQDNQQKYAHHLAELVALHRGISMERLQNYIVTEDPRRGTIVMTFDLIKAHFPNEPSSETVIQQLQKEISSQSLHFVDFNGNKLELCTTPSFYQWSDNSPCPDQQCGTWGQGMTWEESGGRCSILQGIYSCVCTDKYQGTYCTDKQSSGISRQTIIIMIVVFVVAVVLVAFIVVFLCARYKAGSSPRDDMPLAYHDRSDMDSELALKDIYSTLSKGKPRLAYNDRSFSVENISVGGTMSHGKGS